MMGLVSRAGLAKIPWSSFCAVGSTFSSKVIRNLTTPSSEKTSDSSSSYKFVVLGGGTGGLSMASYLSRKYPHQVAVVEPEKWHYYQSMWTLVGAGLKSKDQTMKSMSQVMPPQAKWMQEKVSNINADENFIVTESGHKVKYDFLIVALGLQLHFEKIPGLVEALDTHHVSSNYSINTVGGTFNKLQKFSGGNALFTVPTTPVKCLGAPQKIMYLAEEIFTENGVRDNANITFKTPAGTLFGVEKYRNSLLQVCKDRNINIDLHCNLISIDPVNRKAIFEHVNDESTPKKTETVDYNFMHVTPPMGPVDVLKSSSIVDATGFVDVDPETLQHVKYSNIFSIGDCSNLAVSKTAAAAASQSGVLRKNITSALNGKELTAKYNGYTSCPLVTRSNKCILAEFDYSGLPRETFPIDQGREQASMYFMKANVMPEIYWNFMLKGKWSGPERFRRLMHLGMV
ncbi:sulfide:quinone oxidoreductase, mitochondrial-like [Hydractinia symbiolongicarpus]|uniref:sulfide:quinone oxidoreductase, mitochondrial-like n=1 Tax=Hydractinia symbiolongicarpus TaxID=13093 RepID=UPI002550CBA5|nr:sulfide:quinone oxidoreductase, mitochondrial-like [Hydractinia symbiolongicarpus]